MPTYKPKLSYREKKFYDPDDWGYDRAKAKKDLKELKNKLLMRPKTITSHQEIFDKYKRDRGLSHECKINGVAYLVNGLGEIEIKKDVIQKLRDKNTHLVKSRVVK